MQVVGIVPASVTALGTGTATSVRVSSSGYLERVASPSASDEVVGTCDTDGTAYVSFSSHGALVPAGSVGDMQTKASATTLGSVSPGTSGNVLTSNGSAWVSQAPAASLVPAGNVGDVQVKATATTLGAVAPGTSGNVLTSNGSAWASTALPAGLAPAGNVGELQTKASATTLGAISGTGASGKWLKNDGGAPTWTTLPPGVPYQEVDIAANVETGSTVYTRAGALTLNMADFPDATSVVFKATIETSLATSAYYAEVRLFDITHSVAVTGTTMDNSSLSSSDRATATEFTSAALTVGSASGDLRNDVATVYAVQVRVAGTVTDESTQWAVLSNARLKVTS